MTAITTSKLGALAAAFGGQTAVDDLGSGIKTGYGVIGYKGKVWSIRHRGENMPLMRPNNEGPVASIEVVIVKSAAVVSKLYYAGDYVNNSSDRPTCFSTNGVTPDVDVPERQHPSCIDCQHNQWGSKITPAGKRSKACQDRKRLAVVPLQDIANESFGGPLLLSVPPASLQDLAIYGAKMQQFGYPYYAVGTKISFDHTVAHQKFVFNEIRALTNDEADIVMKHRDSAMTARILSEGIEQSVVPESSAEPAFVAPAPAQPSTTPAPAASPVTTPVTGMPTTSVPTSAGVNVGAFGGAPAPSTQQAAPPAPASASASNGGGKGSFEANLDEALDKLLPK